MVELKKFEKFKKFTENSRENDQKCLHFQSAA